MSLPAVLSMGCVQAISSGVPQLGWPEVGVDSVEGTGVPTTRRLRTAETRPIATGRRPLSGFPRGDTNRGNLR